MKESYWGYWLIVLGVFVILIMLLVQNVTATNTQDYYLAKEIAEASMIDAVDYGYYREYGEVRIIKEKFIESFVRRFAESASVNSTYKIEFYEIYEVPPKVSVKVSTNSSSFNIAGDSSTFKIVNKIDMILEADPSLKYPESIDDGNYDNATTALKSIYGTDRYITKTGDNEYTIYSDTGQIIDKNCNIITATFEKDGADSIGYTTYKCIPEKDGKCDIFLPQIYKSNGNVFGWSTTKGSKNNLLTPGSKVTISGNTTYYAVTDNSIVTYNYKFIQGDNVTKVDATSLSCTIKASENSCRITLPKVTTANGYTFKGWSTSQDGSSGLTAGGTVVTVSRNDNSTTKTYYAIVEKNTIIPVIPTPSNNNNNSNNNSNNKPKDTTSCLTDDIYSAHRVDGDVTNATAWPQYASVTLYNDNNKDSGRKVSAGTPMRIHSCDSTYCKVWIKGDDCSQTYNIKQSEMLINLPDYIPSLHYGGKAVANQSSKKRRGLVLNKKFNENMPIVPTRFAMAKKLLAAQTTIINKGKKVNEQWSLYIDDLYRPVSAQGNPNYKSNYNCMYEACGISYHAFAGAVDASLVWYTNGEWKSFNMPKWKGGSGTVGSSTSAQKKNYNILKDALVNAGLKVYSNEWWHFNEQSAINDRSSLSNNKSKWATYKKMAWGNYAWVFDLSKINKAGATYSYLDFLPKLYYED